MSEKFEIVVSGAAQVSHYCPKIKELTKEVGREITRQNCNLVSGGPPASPILPLWAALGLADSI